jgi:AcrR family transcriptional regulator
MTDTARDGARRPDRRRQRHEATKQEIVDAAWAMVRVDGLNALSLRGLARSVDMEPQSLYTYFASKHALYDALFTDGNRELLARCQALEPTTDRRRTLAEVARLFVAFCTEDQARYELLFMRTIPGFEPTADSYAIAVEVFEYARQRFADAGVRSDADVDLWTAVISGLASQQLANDPDGDRYARLIDQATEMFLSHLDRTS